MVEKICNGNTLCAIVLRAEYIKEGIQFFTGSSDTLQLGYMRRSGGYRIPAHYHKPVKRYVEFTHEVLFVKRGSVRVGFYDANNQLFNSVIISTGDTILLMGLGHGFEMLEDTEMIEVKQGPYAGDDDKVKLK